jgi:hypothetical protein
LHACVTAGFAVLFIGLHYWLVSFIILVTHFCIDGWKSYRPRRVIYFLIDQLLHFLVIVGCWIITFKQWGVWSDWWQRLNTDIHGWLLAVSPMPVNGSESSRG